MSSRHMAPPGKRNYQLQTKQLEFFYRRNREEG